MADQDSDRWIFEVLAPHLRREMKNLKDEIQWTDLVYVPLVSGKTQLLEYVSQCTITKENTRRRKNSGGNRGCTEDYALRMLNH